MNNCTYLLMEQFNFWKSIPPHRILVPERSCEQLDQPSPCYLNKLAQVSHTYLLFASYCLSSIFIERLQLVNIRRHMGLRCDSISTIDLFLYSHISRIHSDCYVDGLTFRVCGGQPCPELHYPKRPLKLELYPTASVNVHHNYTVVWTIWANQSRRPTSNTAHSLIAGSMNRCVSACRLGELYVGVSSTQRTLDTDRTPVRVFDHRLKRLRDCHRVSTSSLATSTHLIRCCLRSYLVASRPSLLLSMQRIQLISSDLRHDI